MKISLSWILDHIAVSKKEISTEKVIDQLNSCTAEIEGAEHIITDTSSLFLARVVQSNDQEIELECPELKKHFQLPSRKEKVPLNTYILVKKENNAFRSATLPDLGSEKEGLVAPLWIADSDAKGAWRDRFENEDHILHIDNKALTNRPDLWGHRGFAREVAALTHKELRPEDYLLSSLPIKHYERTELIKNGNFSLEIEPCGKEIICKRFAMVAVPSIEWRASLLNMATRLARIDSRPIDALVDMTNYVMFDIGQPMHAFDADAISTKKIVARCAYNGEKLKLIDDETIELTSTDYVITDGARPLALAGVMGGAETAVDQSTRSLLLEAANFDASAIRRTATHYKKRTESSTRFEKSLDPNQNTTALLRYLKLLDEAEIPYTVADSISSVGDLAQDKVISVTHSFIEKKIGMALAPEKIEDILSKLGFGIEIERTKEMSYKITVPTYRSTKDITIAEDILEEIARFIGFSAIRPLFPLRTMEAFDSSGITRKRAFKKLLAYGLSMRELSTYAFYNEEFLARINYNPQDALRVANPLSAQWQRLVTSLIPNLFQAVFHNEDESMRFFECNRVWFEDASGLSPSLIPSDPEASARRGPYAEEIARSPKSLADPGYRGIEEEECAGIWFEKKRAIDFYEGKALVNQLFSQLHYTVQWRKPDSELEPWYDKNQSAHLWQGDRIVGQAGKVAEQFLKQIADGDAFIFELDLNALLGGLEKPLLFKPLKKYPSTHLDISLLVPVEVTSAGIEKLIMAADSRIRAVSFVESFVRPEWQNKKSLTLRFEAYDTSGTLTKESIDDIWNHVVKAVSSMGAEIR